MIIHIWGQKMYTELHHLQENTTVMRSSDKKKKQNKNTQKKHPPNPKNKQPKNPLLLLEICIPLQPAGSQRGPWQLKPWEVKHNSTEASLLFSCFFILGLCLIPKQISQTTRKPWAQWSILELTWSRSPRALVCHHCWFSHGEQAS